MRLTEANVRALDPGHALLHPADDAAAALAAPHRHGVEDFATVTLEGAHVLPGARYLYTFHAHAEDGLSVAGATHLVTLRATDAGAWIVVERAARVDRLAAQYFAAYRCHPPGRGVTWETLGGSRDFADATAALDPEYRDSDRWIVGIVPADVEEAT